MSVINLLSREISELIAAGEVIERPSSVIKELVENSIDSGAGNITVEIKNGGITYMRVTDDGSGMSFEDVPKAFLRHATSKICSKDDLDNIITLGFRGEALASVSAVSRVEVMTKQKDEIYGTVYNIEGSEEVSHEKGGCPDGTTIIIRDLFYNVPARHKFLKKDVTEANSISQIVQKIAISHPEIAFRLIRDNRMEFNTSGNGDLYSAIHSVYGKEMAHDMIPADHIEEGIHVRGYVIKPLYAKSNRSFQNFFVNGRYIKSKLCSSAVESAYTNFVMTGKFPCCVLMIEIEPSAMDVNIHPSKAEVRFTDEKKVTDAIFFAVKNALMKDGLVYEFQLKQPSYQVNKETVPLQEYVQPSLFTPVDKIEETEKAMHENQNIGFSVPLEEKLPESTGSNRNDDIYEYDVVGIKAYQDYSHDVKDNISEEIKKKTDIVHNVEEPVSEQEKHSEPEPEKISAEKAEGFNYISRESFVKTEKLPENPEIQNNPLKKEFPDIKVIGEAFGLYIIAESGNKMIIIDKHAAHERIIFERLKSRNCRQYSQKLLTPVKILLTSEEIDLMESNTELLEDLGFECDFSESPCINVTAVPTFVINLDIEEIISEIAENFRMHKNNPQSEKLDDILHNTACKSAIKANDKNSLQEMQSLAEQVCWDEKIRHCPHGRPVMFTMTKSNIDHQFRRT